MTFQPLHDLVAICPVDPELKTTAGLILPDIARPKPQQGDVVAVGPGRRDRRGARILPALKPGQRVVFNKSAGNEINVEGEMLLIMQERDVLAVIQHSLFDERANWLRAAQRIAAAALVAVVGVVAAWALGKPG
jgi:chaperonin GroES